MPNLVTPMNNNKDRRPHLFATDTEVGDFVRAFEKRTLPYARWTHGSHLAVGCFYVSTLGHDGALRHMPGRIRRYNEAVGVVNSDSDGYHHTVTVFYLRLIADYLELLPKKVTLADAVNLLTSSPLAAKDFPLRFYSEARLMSVAARRRFVAPDLKPLADLAVAVKDEIGKHSKSHCARVWRAGGAPSEAS